MDRSRQQCCRKGKQIMKRWNIAAAKSPRVLGVLLSVTLSMSMFGNFTATVQAAERSFPERSSVERSFVERSFSERSSMETVRTTETRRTGKKHSSESGKAETVYVMADASGAANEIIVSEWLRNQRGASVLEDFSNLTDIENVEIMPIGNYILVKQFDENPFQRIVKDPNSGLILDTGGFAAEYKNTDNGKIEEEESFIKVGVIQEVGPECKWCKEGDAVFYTKPSAVPVPFYKQNLQLISENRALAVVNENLKETFKNGK